MSIIEAILLGLVQGLTEFIPVSSSGHLLLAHEVLGSTDQTLGFDVALHVGTLLALIVFFAQDLKQLALNIHKSNSRGHQARLVALATLPAATAGLLFSGYIDDNLRSPMVVAVSLLAVGLIMIAVEKIIKKPESSTSEVSRKQGLLIGLAQATALIPGISRSGATMTAGLLVGLDRSQAARFSFLLAIPIVAGSALGLFIGGTDMGSTGATPIAVGILVSFASGLLAIRFLLNIIARVGLIPFALYRIVLSAVVFAFLV